MHVHIRTIIMCNKYFGWADQRDKVYFIFHKVAKVLCTYMDSYANNCWCEILNGDKTNFKHNPLLIAYLLFPYFAW